MWLYLSTIHSGATPKLMTLLRKNNSKEFGEEYKAVTLLFCITPIISIHFIICFSVCVTLIIFSIKDKIN